MSEEKKTSSKTSKKRRKKNGRRNLIITIFVLVILAVCAALLFLGTGYKKKKNAVTKYFKSYNTSASKQFKNACYPMIWQKKYKLENGMSLEDVVANSFASQQSSSKDSFFSSKSRKFFSRELMNLLMRSSWTVTISFSFSTFSEWNPFSSNRLIALSLFSSVS